MDEIHAAYERFKHLDPVLSGLEDGGDDPIYKTAGALWRAVKAEASKEAEEK